MTSISGAGGFRPPPPGKPPSFDKLDGNSDGVLNLAEFSAGAPKGADSAKTEKLFKAMDTDQDGSVSKAEADAFKAKAEKVDQQMQALPENEQGEQNEQRAGGAWHESCHGVTAAGAPGGAGRSH